MKGTQTLRGISEDASVLRQFHDGMRAYVHTDDGEHADGLMSRRGCGKSCVLSALVFNVFSAAAIHVILQE